MIKAQLLVGVLCVFGYAVFTKAECDVGTVVLKNFDINQYLGQWYSLFHNKQFSETYNCYTDDFEKDDKGYTILSTATEDRKEHKEYPGKIEVDGNTLNFKYDNNPGLSTGYTVLDTDYESYSILAGCPQVIDGVLPYIQFRSPNPSEETMAKVRAALPKTGHTMDEFVATCDFKP